VLLPGQAAAHGFGARYDLRSLSLYLTGAASRSRFLCHAGFALRIAPLSRVPDMSAADDAVVLPVHA